MQGSGFHMEFMSIAGATIRRWDNYIGAIRLYDVNPT
jgi:hypothetical protein